MKKKIKQISKCCGAEVITSMSQDFIGDDINSSEYIGTCNFECTQCGKPCDITTKRRNK